MTGKASTKGFSAVEVVIVIVVILALGLGGWFVWQKARTDEPTDKKNPGVSQNNKNGGEQSDANEPNYLLLANESVRLTLPEEWPYIKGSPDYCRLNFTSEISSCTEAAIITPGAERATQAGGPNYFGISVSVYENPRNNRAQTWIEQDLDEGSAFATDKTSRDPINGYDTYYWKKAYSGDGTNFEDVYYVFTTSDKAVLIYARIYAPRTLDDGTTVGDFRKFESGIADMAKTIRIQ